MPNNINSSEESLFSSLAYKYLPFWPLFSILLALSVAGAWAYLHFLSVPVYEVTASLLIKDEQKGVNESKMTESIDAFTSNKTVENEINVIHSRALLAKVVNKLALYAPIYEEAKFNAVSAYTSSPIKIKLKDPDRAISHPKVYFTYNSKNKTVRVDGKNYPLDRWVQTRYGTLKFIPNGDQTTDASEPLYFAIVPPEQITNELLAKIRIQSSSKFSSVVNLYLNDPVPQRGEDILNKLIQSYRQKAIDDRNKLAANTLDFVEDRIQQVVSELQTLESEVVQFKSTQGGVNLSEQGKLFLENVRDNDRKISEINTQLAVLDKVERYVVSRNSSASFVPSTLGISDPVLSQLLEQLYNSETQYQKLSGTTAENNPILVSVSNEIESIRPRILENIRNQRVNLVASRSTLSSTNNQYSSALGSIPEKERQLMELSRQQDIKNNASSFLLQKREETVLSYAPTTEESQVIDMAGTSSLPVSPKPLYIYLMAIIGACTAGLAVVAGKEMLNSKLLFRSEITQYTTAPIVAELAYKKPAEANMLTAPTEASVIEQFRQLRTTLGLYGRTFTKRKILVTSSIPGEGKSYVSTNLALSLASSGKKVALVDFDLRNPNSSVQLDLYKQRGIIEFLRGEATAEEITVASKFGNLSVLPAGYDIGDHTELLLNGKLEDLFSYLENSFDYLIIDTPPVDLVSDAYLLSEYCDITILVMRHDYTPKTVVKRLLTDNKLQALHNATIVFNGVKPRGFAKGRYGYGYGYGYESKYNDKTYRSRSAAVNV